MITKYELAVEANNKLLDLPIKREYITESQAKAEELIQELINKEENKKSYGHLFPAAITHQSDRSQL